MIELFNKPVGFFLLIMSIILVTPLLSERVRLPGIIGIIVGGMLIGPYGFGLIEAGERRFSWLDGSRPPDSSRGDTCRGAVSGRPGACS